MTKYVEKIKAPKKINWSLDANFQAPYFPDPIIFLPLLPSCVRSHENQNQSKWNNLDAKDVPEMNKNNSNEMRKTKTNEK